MVCVADRQCPLRTRAPVIHVRARAFSGASSRVVHRSVHCHRLRGRARGGCPGAGRPHRRGEGIPDAEPDPVRRESPLGVRCAHGSRHAAVGPLHHVRVVQLQQARPRLHPRDGDRVSRHRVRPRSCTAVRHLLREPAYAPAAHEHARPPAGGDGRSALADARGAGAE